MPQLFQPQLLTEQERGPLEQEFQKLSTDPQEMDILWQKLHAYFAPLDAKVDFSFFHDYFRWYTDLTWKNIYRLKPDEFCSLAIGRQTYKAIQLGFDITHTIAYYLEFNCFDEGEMKTMFEKIRQAFVSSSSIIGMEKGIALTFSEFLKRLEKVKNLDALQKAEYYTQWSPLLGVPNAYKEYYIVQKPDSLIDHIEGIATFFTGVESKNIFYLVQAYMHPGLFDKEPASVPESSPAGEPQPPVAVPQDTVKVSDNNLPPTLLEIKNLVDSQFEKDESGQYTDIEGVFGLLDALAEEYQDERIKELLYFDENSGGFIWVSE